MHQASFLTDMLPFEPEAGLFSPWMPQFFPHIVEHSENSNRVYWSLARFSPNSSFHYIYVFTQKMPETNVNRNRIAIFKFWWPSLISLPNIFLRRIMLTCGNQTFRKTMLNSSQIATFSCFFTENRWGKCAILVETSFFFFPSPFISNKSSID